MTDLVIVKPVTVTAATVTDSNVSELHSTYDPAAWVSAAAYSEGDLVGRTTTHKVYVAKTNHSGETTAPESDTTNWRVAYATNKFKMFDRVLGLATKNETTIEQEITPTEEVDTVTLHGVVGNTVTVTRGSHSETKTARNRLVRDWYEFFTEPYVQRSDVVFTIPTTGGAITVTIDAGAGSPANIAECGECFVGLAHDVGPVEAGATAGIIDYSTKDADDFGNFTVTERAFAKRMQVRMLLDTADVAALQWLLASLRATVAVYIGKGDDFEVLVVAGFYRALETVIAYPEQSLMSLEVEGVT